MMFFYPDTVDISELGDGPLNLDMKPPSGIGGLDPRKHASPQVGARNVQLAAGAIGRKAQETPSLIAGEPAFLQPGSRQPSRLVDGVEEPLVGSTCHSRCPRQACNPPPLSQREFAQRDIPKSGGLPGKQCPDTPPGDPVRVSHAGPPPCVTQAGQNSHLGAKRRSNGIGKTRVVRLMSRLLEWTDG